ncbi:MAG: PaaI family thioesterase [Candidatus Baltobacteraceae bacterium]
MQLHFERDGDQAVRARTHLRAEFQGWQGIAHGGIGLALLDEAMAHAAGAAGYRGLTASINARFRRPVPLQEELDVRARVRWMRRKKPRPETFHRA